jgi:hypothetical protein
MVLLTAPRNQLRTKSSDRVIARRPEGQITGREVPIPVPFANGATITQSLP